nr:amidohydrolase family protein [Pseudonocardia nigra]
MPTPRSTPAPRTALAGVRVFDGHRLTDPTTVVIDGPVIAPVGAPVSGPVRTVDADGAVLLPGLIDAHVHLNDRGTLEQLCSHGVTTCLDMATWPPPRVASLRGLRGLTDIRSAGTPAIGPGGLHARIPGMSDEAIVRAPEDAWRFVEARVGEGSDYLKIVLEAPGEGGPDQAIADALVEAAHARGTTVVAHAATPGAYTVALDAGADIITHMPLGTPLLAGEVGRMATAERVCVPTLTMMEGIAAARGAAEAFAAASRSVAALHQAGVVVLAGTDANATPGVPFAVPHGESLHHELELLVAAGLSPAAALRAATSEPARASSASPTAAPSNPACAPTSCSSTATRSPTSAPPAPSVASGAAASSTPPPASSRRRRHALRTGRARDHLRAPRLRRTHLRHRRGAAQLRGRGQPRPAGTAARPRTGRVVVGLRAGDDPARRRLRGLRGGPARPGPVQPHPGPVHGGQLRQRPGALRRRLHPTSGDRERPVLGRVVSAWLSAYAPPGMVRAACYEDPPLFASELHTSCGQSIRQAIGPVFALFSTYLGDQWRIGDWAGLRRAARHELPPPLAGFLEAGTDGADGGADEPPQNMKEYDPEWARAFCTGTATASCDHARMLAAVKVPVLLTHHFRHVDEATGTLVGALSDLQARRAGELISAAGQRFDYRSFPEMGHYLHSIDPACYVATLREWVGSLPEPDAAP